MSSRPVLLFQLGQAPPGMVDSLGDYPRWFEAAWGGALHLVDGRPGGAPPDPRAFAGVIISGSPASLAAPEPWMEDAAELVRACRRAGTPLLGVCFGHQLIGHALGGRVITNPRGWEVGHLTIELTEAGAADPLFRGLPPRLSVNLTHRDVIDPASCPADLRILARNAATDIQALAVDDFIWGVQFHPEIDGAILRGYIAARRSLLTMHDCDALHAAAADSPHGVQVLRNFAGTVLTS